MYDEYQTKRNGDTSSNDNIGRMTAAECQNKGGGVRNLRKTALYPNLVGT